MATGSPSDVATLILSLASARPATLGAGRLVCVDGPAGSGKTTLGAELADRTGAQLIHGDDLMEGWRGLDAVGRQLAGLVVGRWPRAAPGATSTTTGCTTATTGRSRSRPRRGWSSRASAAAPPRIAAYTTVLVWVEVDDDLRLARGLERDGDEMQELWRQFMLDERELFARERIRERADVVVDGTGRVAPVIR